MNEVINLIRRYFFILPVLYLLLAVLLLRNSIIAIYLSTAIMVGLGFAINYKHKFKPVVFIAQWMLILSSVGLVASINLSIEQVEMLSSSDYVSSCSLSPIVACSSVITSEQSSVFGFSNPYIGIFGFAAILTAGMTILAGATKLHKIWWQALIAGIAANLAFCIWLFYQGIFVIGSLCLYCLLVWLVTSALFWLVADFCVKNKYISLGKKLSGLLSHKYELIILTYSLIFLTILIRWIDYWRSLL